MNEYKSLKKTKTGTFGVLIALLILFEACALIVLGSRLMNFTNAPSRNMFSLTHSDARTTVKVGKMDANGKVHFPESMASLPALKNTLHTFQPLATSDEPSGESTVWLGLTDVELFKVSYENGEGIVTVDGGGEKVIDPGTSHVYSFTLTNNADVALDYSLNLSALMNFGDHDIPLKVRLRTADGDYAVGSETSFEDMDNLEDVVTKNTLGAGRCHTYTLEWEWAFEDGNDEYDTFLGSVMVGTQSATITLTIETEAMQSADPDNNNGDLPPTGDDNSTFWWFLLAILAMAAIYGIYKARERQELKNL